MMRIGIAGIAGRMGRQAAQAVRGAACTLAGGTVGPGDAYDGAPVFADIAALAAASDVVIDFTHPSAVEPHAAALSRAGVAWVLGTTGLPDAAQAAVAAASARCTIVQAANFSPGVNLVLALARQLAAALPAEAYDAEIVEMHHRQKVDAPSGTALALGHAVAAGRGVALADVARSGRDGMTGARRQGEIGFAALRGGQVVGEHTLLFASAFEQIELTHTALDRRIFAEGALRAALWTAGKPPGLYGMQDVLYLNS